MACPDSINLLKNISAYQKAIFDILNGNVEVFIPVQQYPWDIWTVEKIGKDYSYQTKVLLTGAAQNIDLAIPFGCVINRIEYFSDDTTAKSFSERVFSGVVDISSYDELMSVTDDVNQPIAYYPTSLGEGRYTQRPIKIRTAISASTVGKYLTKKVEISRI